MSMVDVHDLDGIQTLIGAFFRGMVDHDASQPGEVVARVRRGTITSSVEQGGGELEVLTMRLGPLALASPPLPLHLEAVAANCVDNSEVITSPGLGFAFLEALREANGPNARISMSKCPELADDDTAEVVWLHL